MAEVIKMPKMSDTMTEGVIASWLVKVGDTVESGDILAEVETDKATMELENYEDGVILHIGVSAGEAVPIDGVIAVIGEEGEDISELLQQVQSGNSSSELSQESTANQQVEPATEAPIQSIDVSDINAEIIRMPKMSDTMTEGVIASWLVKVGDTVESGDILAEVETDKATMELENYTDGTILYIGAEAGQGVPIDGVIAIIGESNADFQKLLDAEKAKNATPAPSEVPSEAPKKEAPTSSSTPAPTAAPQPVATATTTTSSNTTSSGRVKASPLAKRMAKEMGYNLADISGTGENGRIIKRDIENYTPAPKPTPSTTSSTVSTVALGQESFTEEPLSQMRKTIARRLSESKFEAPHFYLTMEINMDKAIEARKSINAVAPTKISFNDMVIKATASALRKHPNVNAAWLDDKIRYSQHIHIGVAVAIPEGLIVPVVRFADQKSLSQIGTEVKELATKAKDKKLQPEDWEGNTFSISNLGMFGIEEFTAIINPPDSCIMAIGGIKQTPIVKDGEIKIGNVMKVTLSCDHRVVDGAVGAAFLQTFKELLEDPVRILI